MALTVALLVSFAFLAIGTLVVTVGGWYSARAMDQNAADGAALAVAQSCATTCQLSLPNNYIGTTANGKLAGSTDANTPCGTLVSISCPSGYENGTRCPIPAEQNGQPIPYVDVRITPNTGGTGFMSNLFGGGKQQVAACAQAALTTTSPTTCAACVAMTISTACWNGDTSNGGTFATPPSPPSFYDTYTGAVASDGGSEVVIVLKSSPSATATCTGHSNAAGSFGWLSKSSCTVTITNGTYGTSTGASASPCQTVFNQSRSSSTPIYLPVFSAVAGTGSNATYTLRGFAAFVVTGYDIHSGGGGWSPKSLPSSLATNEGGQAAANANYCQAYTKQLGATGADCVFGYFTHGLVSGSNLGGSGGGSLGLWKAFLSG